MEIIVPFAPSLESGLRRTNLAEDTMFTRSVLLCLYSEKLETRSQRGGNDSSTSGNSAPQIPFRAPEIYDQRNFPPPKPLFEQSNPRLERNAPVRYKSKIPRPKTISTQPTQPTPVSATIYAQLCIGSRRRHFQDVNGPHIFDLTLVGCAKRGMIYSAI